MSNRIKVKDRWRKKYRVHYKGINIELDSELGSKTLCRSLYECKQHEETEEKVNCPDCIKLVDYCKNLEE